jgi:RimJ/RimL family protein N-acetyltransferase
MFGVNILVKTDRLILKLVPVSSEDLPHIARNFSSMKVFLYTQQLYSQTLENEKEWFNKVQTSATDVVWGLLPDGEENLIGITGLHRKDYEGSCVSGIIIWDTAWWGKGVASHSHLARTLWAADYDNRLTIKSHVRSNNHGSYKALEKVGYLRTGIELRTCFREGKFLDTYGYQWVHPERLDVLFREEGGVPPQQYQEGINKAQKALDLARQVVSFP